MNTDILLAGEGQPAQLAEGFDQARQFIQSGEARFSRFLEDSELSELNRSAGRWFRASADLFSLLVLVQQYFHQTGGLFDPSILPDLLRAGYDRSMDQLRAQGTTRPAATRPVDARPSFQEVMFDDSRHRILVPDGMALDLGGIAKGWIAEQAAQRLSEYAAACAVNAGGDLFLVGLPEGQEFWPVALEDPLLPEAVLTTLRIAPGAVATSTVTKRTWRQGEKQRHHLIDPRTGEPAITTWLSVTVIAAHAYQAEVFAKTMLIAGPERSEEIADHSPTPFSYLAVDRDRKIWGNQNSLEYVYVH